VLTLAAARKMVAAAEAEAERHHLAGVVAVVDDGGWPILIETMDHAAYTASVELGAKQERRRCSRSRAGRSRMRLTTRGFIEMKGGLPIVVDGEVIGAVGASFDTTCRSRKPE
jgi:glc operon protein GlcG